MGNIDDLTGNKKPNTNGSYNGKTITKTTESIYDMNLPFGIRRLHLDSLPSNEITSRDVRDTILKIIMLIGVLIGYIVLVFVADYWLIKIGWLRHSGSHVGLGRFAAAFVTMIIAEVLSIIPDKKMDGKYKKIRANNYVKHLNFQINEYKEKLRPLIEDVYRNPETVVYEKDSGGKPQTGNFRPQVNLTKRVGTGLLDISSLIIAPSVSYKNRKIFDKSACRVKDECSFMENMPQVIDLGTCGAVGIVGDGDKVRAYDVARSLIVQLLSGCNSADVKLAFVYDEDESDEWSRCSVLPHTRFSGDDRAMVAGEGEAARVLLDTIADMLAERTHQDCYNKYSMYPYIILFVADVSVLAGHRISRYITGKTCTYSFTIVTLTDSREDLLVHTSCEMIVSKEFSGIHRLMPEAWIDVDFDYIDSDGFGQFIDDISCKTGDL